MRDPYGAGAAAYGAMISDGPGHVGFDLLEYWRIFYKRRWLIVGIVLAIVTLGAVRTLMMTPIYTASVRLQIDRNALKVVEGSVAPGGDSYDFEFMKTHYELLQSRALAERVASTLRLGEDADFFKPRTFSLTASLRGLLSSADEAASSPGDTASRQRWAAGIVVGNRTVRAVPGARLVDVSYADPNPGRAQRIANAYAEAFVASNLDKRFEANAYAKTFLQDQTEQLRLRLEDAERELLEFAEREQILVLTEKSSIAENNLAAANVALGGIVAERIKNEELWKQVESANAINLPQLLSNGMIDSLRARRNALVTEYEEKLQTFKPAYPAMVQLNNKIKEVDRQLASEVKTIKDAYRASFDSSVNQERSMREQIETLRAEVLDYQKRSIQHNILKREVDTTRGLYNGLLQRHKEVDIAGGVGTNNVFIVDRAEQPGGPSSPNLSRALMLSFVLGLGAGLGLAYLLERIDDTIRSAEEMERIIGLATLGVIPKVASKSSVEEELADLRSSLSEAYRSLCTSLQFSTESGLPKTLLVTSAGPSEGKSITALAIARHFATMGLKVLVIDGDLRNPSMHIRFGLPNTTGLSNYLTGACAPPDAFQRTGIRNLAFMASGPLPPNAADLLGSARLLSLLSIGQEVFDLIVMDGPPVMGLADAPLLSNAAAATIFVIGAGQSRSGLVRGAVKRLQFARAPVIGAVLTKFDARSAGYGYGYGYGYESYGYGSVRSQAVEPTAEQPQIEGMRKSA